MLYNVVVDERGGTTYVPTALGNVLLGAVIIALLAAAVVFAKMHAKKLGEDRKRQDDHKAAGILRDGGRARHGAVKHQAV